MQLGIIHEVGRSHRLQHKILRPINYGNKFCERLYEYIEHLRRHEIPFEDRNFLLKPIIMLN